MKCDVCNQIFREANMCLCGKCMGCCFDMCKEGGNPSGE